MHLLFYILLIFLFIPSYLCQNNLTYVFSTIPTSEIETLLQSNGFILSNSSYVTRLLSSLGVDFLNATQTILAANNIQSIAFSWNTGDCSFPTALALKYTSINVSSPICYTEITPSTNNFLQLTITNQGLASAATVFMRQYALNYFSIIIGSSNSFYFNLAQQFSTYLTESNFILDQFLFVSSFTSSILSSSSKG